ncbi:hypothetical protein [Saccharospirillum salsuginis]|uniref:Uncharacterized protein n=1 Tax=Saccharospirillum salsuginis TaxID=418750 RepID=A0A918K7Z8_9GAMM|nr:hypothetical protein [Saccharospirillum salsuginis]GGX53979.1 hypothetical protein GCM10007392_21620 [Saccharospirillum salsuginis]
MNHGKPFNGPTGDDSMMLTTALARFARHVAEQDYQLDLLALYQQLDKHDPLRRQCERIRAIDCSVVPNLLPLADLAIALDYLEKFHQNVQ